MAWCWPVVGWPRKTWSCKDKKSWRVRQVYKRAGFKSYLLKKGIWRNTLNIEKRFRFLWTFFSAWNFWTGSLIKGWIAWRRLQFDIERRTKSVLRLRNFKNWYKVTSWWQIDEKRWCHENRASRFRLMMTGCRQLHLANLSSRMQTIFKLLELACCSGQRSRQTNLWTIPSLIAQLHPVGWNACLWE